MKDFFNKCRPYDFATHFFDWRQSVILARETRGQKRRLTPGVLILGASDSCACVYFDSLARFSCAKITDRLHACMPVLQKMNCDQSNEISGLSFRYCWRRIAKLRRSSTLKSENKLFSSCNLSFLRSRQFTCLTEQQLLTIVHFVGFKLSKASLRCPDWLLRGKSHTDFLQLIAWFPFFVLILLFCFDIQVR